MSLNWSIEKVRDFKELYVCEETEQTECQLKPMTERIIFLTMELDLGDITDKNIDEWMVRLGMMKRCGWAPRTEITRADIERHIGLHTNVRSTTRAGFRGKLIKHVEGEAVNEMKKGKTKCS